MSGIDSHAEETSPGLTTAVFTFDDKPDDAEQAAPANGQVNRGYGVSPVSPPPGYTELPGGEEDKVPAACNGHSVSAPDGSVVSETELSWRRWLVLGLFVLHSMSNAFQWIQYSIITNIFMYYYGVSSLSIDWLSIVYMVVYIPLIFPASWMLERKGLRWVVLAGSFGTCLGAWIKCASVSPDRFYVTFIGQTVCAISQIFILGIPPRLAAVWFGPKEVSTACSVGVFGNQFGVALGFLLPPVLVSNSDDIAVISRGLNVMFYGVAAVTSVLFLLIILVFRAEPAKPPSPAAAAARVKAQSGDENYLHSILRLVRNKSYILLLLSYGINVGVYYAISTLLNQIILAHFPGEEMNAGRIGLTLVVAGMLGSVVCGVWLDKTHTFKETTIAVYVCSLVGMVAFTFNFMAHQIWVVFVIAGLLGFFMTGYLPVGFEFAAEITYPESEGTSSGLLNASAQVFGILFTLGSGWLLTRFDDLTSNLALTECLLDGLVMTVFVKSELRRQMAQSSTPTPGSLEPPEKIAIVTENGHSNNVIV